jgi:hypothetical protein
MTGANGHTYTGLYQGFGITRPHFVNLREQTVERAKLFWQTYLTGVGASVITKGDSSFARVVFGTAVENHRFFQIKRVVAT